MRNYKVVRCGSGLGDSLYLQSVARHLVKQGKKIHVATNYPDIFKHLNVGTRPFTREGIDIIAHYSLRRRFQETTQFKDCCLQAGITENAELKLDWTIENTDLVGELKAHGKPIMLVQMARNPMNRRDNFAMDILPKYEATQALIDTLKSKYLMVLIGSGKQLHEYQNIDVDLTNKTTITDILDLGLACDAMLGYCSFMIPLAESFDKPCLMVWARKGLKSQDQVIRSITPQKIIHKSSTKYVIDDYSTEQLTEAANEFKQTLV